MTHEKRILLVLIMTCPHEYNTLAQLWQNIKDITPDQAIQMFKDEIRCQKREDDEYEKDYGKPGTYIAKCKKCKKTGHKEEDCWKDMICEKCGKRGHPAERCYNRVSRPEKMNSKNGKNGKSNSKSNNNLTTFLEPEY